MGMRGLLSLCLLHLTAEDREGISISWSTHVLQLTGVTQLDQNYQNTRRPSSHGIQASKKISNEIKWM